MTQTELGRTPAVFVSSTCYDLKQIRNDIRDFIHGHLGYEAILSEFDSFPLDPEITAVDNCIRAVKQRADIFCLIIGGRYGSIADSGKSVTNLEYINARAKGIPIYAFVEKAVLSILPVWERNPDADFSNIVDSTELFRFVAELRRKENIWMYEFENAQDITRALRKQLGYLFYDSLKTREKMRLNRLPYRVQQLEGNALKIAIEKPVGWEYLFFGEILEQNLNRYIELKRDLIYGLSLGSIIKITKLQDLLDYLSAKIDGLQRIIDNMNILFKSAIPEAFGAPGEPGDEEKIIYVGERLGAVYESLVKWGLEFKILSIDEKWSGIVNTIAKMWELPITDLDDYMIKYKNGMKKLKSHTEKSLLSATPETLEFIDLTLVLRTPDIKEYLSEVEKLRRNISLSDLGEF